MYVFDTSIFIILFTYYYPRRFPTLWNSFNDLVHDGRIISTRENLREINETLSGFQEWVDENTTVFQDINAAEGAFVTQIYSVRHFQQNIEQQKLLKGGLNADPFIIAKAAIREASVVTSELHKSNSAKIPNICEHCGIPCLNLEQFMESEGWSF